MQDVAAISEKNAHDIERRESVDFFTETATKYEESNEKTILSDFAFEEPIADGRINVSFPSHHSWN